jgi:hypothetical protein
VAAVELPERERQRKQGEQIEVADAEWSAWIGETDEEDDAEGDPDDAAVERLAADAAPPRELPSIFAEATSPAAPATTCTLQVRVRLSNSAARTSRERGYRSSQRAISGCETAIAIALARLRCAGGGAEAAGPAATSATTAMAVPAASLVIAVRS